MADTPSIQIKSLFSAAKQVPTKLEQMCVESASGAKVVEDLLNLLVYQLEEQEIYALQDPESESYKVLSSTLEKVSTAVKCNVICIIGHTEICENYMKTLQFHRINSLPTVVLIVGCMSNSLANRLNKEQKYTSQEIYFFGFRNLMHCLKGQIFSCEKGHMGYFSMNCDFDGAKQNYDKIKANSTEYQKAYAERLRLLQCCQSKFEVFKQVFYDKLPLRNCSVYPAEQLIKKISQIRTNSGSVIPPTNPIFLLEDGVSCSRGESCKLQDVQYELFKKNANVFEKEVSEFSFVPQTTQIMRNFYSVTVEEHNEFDKFLSEKLRTMKVEDGLAFLHQRLSFPHFVVRGGYPVFFYLIGQRYLLCIKEIEKKYNNLEWDYFEKLFFSNILLYILHLHEEIETRKIASPSSMKNFIWYTEKEFFRLLQWLTRKEKKLWTPGNAIAPVYYLFLPNFHLPYFEFFFKEFPDFFTKPGRVDSFLEKIFEHAKYPEEGRVKLLQILFSIGIFDNDKNYIKLYENGESDANTNTLSPAILHILYSVFFPIIKKKYKLFLPQNRMLFWEKQAADPSASKKNKIRFANYFNAYKTLVETYTISPFEKLSTEQVNSMLDADLAPYVEGAKAMETLPAFFGTLTKQVKKLTKDKTVFNTTIKRLRNIYTERRANLNEGNNALRKRNEIQAAYNEFLQMPAIQQEQLEQARKQAEHEARERAYLASKGLQGGRRTRRKYRR
jgi:hypothetical protein